MTRWVVAAFVLISPGAVNAQVVRGQVVDANTNQPVRLAELELLDSRQKTLASTTADSTGAFRLRGWLAGKYRVRVKGLGYLAVTSDELELGTGDVFELNFRLAVNAVPLDAVSVIARSRSSLTEIALRGYYDRRDYGRHTGIGRFLDRGEIDQRGTKLTDVLRKVPGLRIIQGDRGCVIVAVSSNPTGTKPLTAETVGRNSCRGPTSVCPASIYLDGVQLTLDRVPIDQMVPLDWVEAIEVYRRPSELPAEFLSSGACGVVALWTRRG